ncbi:MAG: SDR family NAD(P)-dependent oxidoreductase [Deltaproteobacteria bacterium]|nr:SDR family NAD(P)-dependent oxidoreductase [Deltaproteobacteria bacterium]
MKLPDRPRAVITGAASGLGRALALELAQRQARLLISDVNVEGADETCVLARARGAEAIAVRADVGVAADLEKLADVADASFGGVDLLVNNAGVAVAGMVGELPLADWEWIVRINLWGAINGCHVFVPRMRKAGGGFILNVASSAGFASLPEMAPYNVTKAAVISLSETLHAELASANIAVSCLCPTFFQTGLMKTFRGADRQRAMAEKFFQASTMSAEQVARAGLRGLERGTLHIIPQTDGTWVWRAKRFLPGTYFGILRAGQKSPRVQKWVGQTG